MGQAISNIVTSLCSDTGQDEFQIPSRTHIFPQRPGPQLIPTPLNWSRGSDSFTHSGTNSVPKQIVGNPPPGSDPDRDSSLQTREVIQLGLGHGHLVNVVIRDESDSVSQLGQDPTQRWSRGLDSFTLSGTNSVQNRIVWNPPPGSDSDGDSSSQTREVSQLGHGHLVTRDLSDSVSQLSRDPVISSPKWLEEFLGESSITIGANTIEVSEVLKEVRERDEERDTFPIPIPNTELVQIPLSSSHGSDLIADLVTHSVLIHPPGLDPVRYSTSLSSELDSVSQLHRDPVISSPKWLEEFLGKSSITVGADTIEVSKVLKEVRERDEKRDTFPIPIPNPELLQIPLSSSHDSDLIANLVTHSVLIPPPGSDPVRYSTSPSSELDSVSQLRRDPVINSPKWLEEFLGNHQSLLVPLTIKVSKVLKEVRERDEERDTFPIPIPNPELLQIPLSSSHDSNLIADVVTHSVSIPPPGSDPVRYSTSPSSESDSMSQHRRDPAITLPKWLDVFLIDSSITVLEENEEVMHEVLREEREREEERGGGAKVGRVERWMKYYSSFQKILLVGEGDFSFSACLAVAFGCARNIIATSLDSRGKTNKTRLAKLILENYVKNS
ncbi:methyltransferase small domain protein, putative [Actinidia rufa]|uniref:Methyltransferase small domain protein, putative n=1 Tax=Actinidia rufa TaxID=165716 RepID=A0A7J0F6U5_9ERIC|nr:methyltransferase small domain protein, putative [Actinidia rufa]